MARKLLFNCVNYTLYKMVMLILIRVDGQSRHDKVVQQDTENEAC